MEIQCRDQANDTFGNSKGYLCKIRILQGRQIGQPIETTRISHQQTCFAHLSQGKFIDPQFLGLAGTQDAVILAKYFQCNLKGFFWHNLIALLHIDLIEERLPGNAVSLYHTPNLIKLLHLIKSAVILLLRTRSPVPLNPIPYPLSPRPSRAHASPSAGSRLASGQPAPSSVIIPAWQAAP